jgi:hypothetical protein
MIRRPSRFASLFAATLLGLFAATASWAQSSVSLLTDGGFENGTVYWSEVSTGGFPIITSDSVLAHSGTNYAYLGDYESGTDILFQNVTIPADATRVVLQFWYTINTFEQDNSLPYDVMHVMVANPTTGQPIATVATYSNMNQNGDWAQTPEFDLTAFRGQTVRLQFVAGNNAQDTTAFFVDDVTLFAHFDQIPPRLIGLSTRMQVLTGNDVGIAGFAIAGSSAKTVVVRARGPSLAGSGIPNLLQNPTLRLVRAADGVTLATNDNWEQASNAGLLLQSGFAPTNSAEPAVLMSLPPGGYTAVVSGVGNATGVAIIEVFEVDTPWVPLAAISTRGQVLTGNDAMIGGFIIQGNEAQTVVVRARGPSLIPAGINNALADPVLTLVRSSDQSVIAVNDNWGEASNAAELQASGFAPSNALESALLVTLPPGAYTAIVRGFADTTGVGIVEVYAR